MKKIISVSIFILIIINFFISSHEVSADIKDSLLLYYNFSEVSDKVVKDISANGKDGVIIGDYTLVNDEIRGQVLNLDGNGSIKLPQNLLAENKKEITITTWVKFTNDNREFSTSQKVFDFGNDIKNSLSLNKSKDILLNNKSIQPESLQDRVYEEEQWVHIAIALNEEEIIYYENGYEVLRKKITNNIFNDLVKYSENYIGKSKYSSDAMFKGQMDEFMIYNKALTESEIQEVMFLNSDESGILNIAQDTLTMNQLQEVRNNINLPQKLYKDIEVSWTSDNETVINADGKVNRPKSGEITEVTINAILKLGAQSRVKTFKAYVIPTSMVDYTLDILNEENKNDKKNEDKNTSYYVEQFWGSKIINKELESKLISNKFENDKEIIGGISLGANDTIVQYDDIIIKSNNTGEILFEDSFNAIKEDWKIIKGNWNVENGVLAINKKSNDYRVYLDTEWTNYTVELKARKLEGENGFLIGIGCKDSSNFYCLNIGNDKNTTIDKISNDVRTIVNESKSEFNIVDGKEYNLKVVVAGKNIELYIDDLLINKYTEKTSEGIITSVGYDNINKEFIIELLNNGDEPKEVMFNINQLSIASPNAVVEYINIPELKDNEGIESVKDINIKKKDIGEVQKSFFYYLDKKSISVIRIRSGTTSLAKEVNNNYAVGRGELSTINENNNSIVDNKINNTTLLSKNYLQNHKGFNYVDVLLGVFAIILILLLIFIPKKANKNIS